MRDLELSTVDDGLHSYGPGVWHHPMLTLDSETDFVVFVHEDGSAEDCVVVDRDGAPWPELDLAKIPAKS